MIYRKYPDDKAVNDAISKKEPLIIAISFDEGTALMSWLDDSVEHHILLQHFGINLTDTDKYWRIVVDNETAEWTFVCPRDYKGTSKNLLPPIRTVIKPSYCTSFP